MAAAAPGVSAKAKVVGLGEVLFDVFSPSKRLLGGAPANFAYHSSLMGNDGYVASCVGDDELGKLATATLDAHGVDTFFIQRSMTCPTGKVMVTLAAGQPTYEIELGAAWDELEFTTSWAELAKSADAVCFGTLAQRSAPSREAIRAFLESLPPHCITVFDINLRQDYYDADSLSTGLQAARICKLNDEEAQPLMSTLKPAAAPLASLEECADFLLADYPGLALICITCGAQGVSLVSRTARVKVPCVKVEVVDTIGAGDAFTAALVAQLMTQPNLELELGEPTAMPLELGESVLSSAAAFASRYASHVCSSAGAMPQPPSWLPECIGPALLKRTAGADQDASVPSVRDEGASP